MSGRGQRKVAERAQTDHPGQPSTRTRQRRSARVGDGGGGNLAGFSIAAEAWRSEPKIAEAEGQGGNPILAVSDLFGAQPGDTVAGQMESAVSLPHAASALSFCPASWFPPVRRESEPGDCSADTQEAAAQSGTAFAGEPAGAGLHVHEVPEDRAETPATSGTGQSSEPRVSVADTIGVVSRVEDEVFPSDGGPVIDVEAVEVHEARALPREVYLPVCPHPRAGGVGGTARVPTANPAARAVGLLAAAVVLIAMGLSYLGRDRASTPSGHGVVNRPSVPSPLPAATEPLKAPNASAVAKGGRRAVSPSRPVAVRPQNRISFPSVPPVRPTDPWRSSGTDEATEEPRGSFREDITVHGPGEPRPPELRAGVEYPPSVRSLLGSYAGEQVTVMLEVDEAGQPHVESVSARFRLSEFVKARFREAVERSHWRNGTDAWGRPMRTSVRLLIPVR